MKRNGSKIGSLPGSICLAALLVSSSAFASAPKEQKLYNFRGSDGSYPDAAMIADKAGNLYGTTNTGGTGACSQNGVSGCGTVFELSPPARKGGSWTETVLYSFQGGNDGAYPNAGLIVDNAGNLYGVTSQGGNGNCSNIDLNGCGVAFELSPSGGAWTETVLYRFKGNREGKGEGDFAAPSGVAFSKSGDLYGIAYDGGWCFTNNETGTFCDGGAFELKKSRGGAWSEKILYRFEGKDESNRPEGALLDAAGNLYGTNLDGGAFDCGSVLVFAPPQSGKGAWTESSLYDFQCGTDGAFPLPGIVFDANGNLYGVSIGTGYEYGNVYELTPNDSGGWTESVLHNFEQSADGITPTVGPIIGGDGSLYGTTQQGGDNNKGVVFSLVPQNGGWSESVLYSFPGGRDGAAPYGGLVFGKGNALYGTTSFGGSMNCANGQKNGCGTVFRVTGP
ncbi:MAG TPA: choice-of-anchor tandem repeat GloVer-containing protein [Rhizomicrobium sp.]|nr:choice-of-anchor tandem repeat GloVer-containing protein [Rhizomicrobium sp.]